jgi:hypothetical protein
MLSVKKQKILITDHRIFMALAGQSQQIVYEGKLPVTIEPASRTTDNSLFQLRSMGKLTLCVKRKGPKHIGVLGWVMMRRLGKEAGAGEKFQPPKWLGDVPILAKPG